MDLDLDDVLGVHLPMLVDHVDDARVHRRVANSRNEGTVRPAADRVVPDPYGLFHADARHRHRLRRCVDVVAEPLLRSEGRAHDEQLASPLVRAGLEVRVSSADLIRGSLGQIRALSIEAALAEAGIQTVLVFQNLGHGALARPVKEEHLVRVAVDAHALHLLATVDVILPQAAVLDAPDPQEFCRFAGLSEHGRDQDRLVALQRQRRFDGGRPPRCIPIGLIFAPFWRKHRAPWLQGPSLLTLLCARRGSANKFLCRFLVQSTLGDWSAEDPWGGKVTELQYNVIVLQ